MSRALPPRFKIAQQAPSAIAAAPKLTLDHRRGTAHQRGYGRAWERLSIRMRKQQPWCAWCAQEGRETLGALVDHMIPVVDRPELLLDWRNCWVICESCHGRKFSLELYARNHGMIDQLPAWCKDPTQRPARFGPAVRTG